MFEVNAIRYLQAMTEGQNREQISRLILFTILWLTLFILSVKVSAAWATRSLSLMAESLQTLLTSFSVLLSLLRTKAPKRARRPSTYGHSKRETVITLLLVAVLGFAGLNLLIMSIQQLVITISGETLTFPANVSLPLIQLLSVVVVTSLGLAILGLYQAKALSNTPLRFNATQLLKDVLLTILLIVGLMGVWVGWVWLDAVLAILLVLLALGSCWQIVNWQLPLLVEQSAIAPEALAQIVREVGGVSHCYQIQSKGLVGRFVQVQMRIIVHPDFTSFTSLILERIETTIQERYGSVQVTLSIDDDLTDSTPENRFALMPDVKGNNGTSLT
ncbi:MAG TPA: cation transporter [Coleofasciculaceae cyanobacterium]|jgi:cation diffusion facilitator family transporter